MEEEVAWRCQNVAGCPAQQTRRLEHFAQRKALDLEGLGGIVAEKLIERGLVSEPLDVFNLTLPELGALNLGTDEEPRVFGEKNAAKLIEAGGTTMDPEKRKTAYTAAIKRAMEQAYWVPLHTYVTTYGFAKNLDMGTQADEMPRFWLAKWK